MNKLAEDLREQVLNKTVPASDINQKSNLYNLFGLPLANDSSRESFRQFGNSPSSDGRSMNVPQSKFNQSGVLQSNCGERQYLSPADIPSAPAYYGTPPSGQMYPSSRLNSNQMLAKEFAQLPPHLKQHYLEAISGLEALQMSALAAKGSVMPPPSACWPMPMMQNAVPTLLGVEGYGGFPHMNPYVGGRMPVLVRPGHVPCDFVSPFVGVPQCAPGFKAFRYVAKYSST